MILHPGKVGQISHILRARMPRQLIIRGCILGVDKTWTPSYGPLHKTLMDPPYGHPLWPPSDFHLISILCCLKEKYGYVKTSRCQMRCQMRGDVMRGGHT